MIEYLSGKVAELTPTTAVVDVNGVGYELNITLTTFSSLEQAVGGSSGSVRPPDRPSCMYMR